MKHILFLCLLAFSFVARAASPAYNTSTGVVEPTQFLKLDAAELKVMGNLVLTNAGAQLWTNISGTIYGNSQVADGSSAVAFRMNSSNALANSDALLLEISNNSTSKFSVTGYGYVNALQFRTLFGDRYGYFGDYLELGDVNTDTFFLAYPWIGDGSAPYVMGTPDTHTSGNLVEVKNNTTNVFTIDYLGNITANNINIPGDQTANNLTITNELIVKGSAKFNTLVVTNSVNFYNNTYVSNFFGTSATVSNDITVLGNYIGTIDPTVSGTTVKIQKSLKLQFPRKVDGAGCTYSNTNDYTSLLFMLPTFSPTAATNVNNCDFAFRVPGDLDTSKDLTASLTIRLTDVDTGAHTYNVGMISIANSASASGTPANYVPLTISGDGSGASGDIESVSNVTLTDWRSNMTAGQWCLLRLNRDGGDASSVASNMMELEIFYWATQ